MSVQILQVLDISTNLFASKNQDQVDHILENLMPSVGGLARKVLCE